MFRLLVASDTHCGSILGLTPPGHHSDDNREWALPFWEFYTDYLAQLGRLDAVVFNGDLIDGPGKKESSEHETTNINKQVKMAAEVLGHVRADKKYIVRGTGYHTDFQGSFEDFVADEMSIDAHDELRLDVHGRKLHFRHVVGRSDTPYGQHTQTAKELINDMMQADLEGYEDADILGRSHVHYSTGSWLMDSNRGVRREVFTNPGLQLRGPRQSSYVRKLRTWMYHVGATLIEIDPDSREHYIRPHIFPIRAYAPQTREYICLTD